MRFLRWGYHPAVRRLSVAILASFAVVASLPAAPKWSYATSAHFEVYTTGGERRGREALTYFERVHAFFEDYLKLAPKPGHPTRLIVFSNAREFQPYRLNEVATAYYAGGPDRDYIVMESLGANSYPVVVHEYVHLVLRHARANYPPWLNEGMAEFFSTLEPEGRRMSLGKVPIGRLQHVANASRLIPLPRLLAIGRDAPEYNTQAHAGTFYSESWALVHMIMADERFRPKAQAFLNQVTAGSDAGAALTTVYGKTIVALQADLEAYIRRQAYTYFLADYRDPPSLEKVPVTPVDDFDAALVMATLLANRFNKETEARAAFEALGTAKPDHLGVIEARALFERQRGKMVEALPFYARAVELGSKNARLYREYAMLVEADDLARAETLLLAGVTIAPDDVETRLRLANLQLRQSKPNDVLGTLKPVTRVSAEQAFMLFQLLANAYARTDRLNEAREAAGLAAKHAQTPGQQSYASTLVKSIADRAARIAETAALQAEAHAAAAAAAEAAAREAAAAKPTTIAKPAPPASPPAGRGGRATTPARSAERVTMIPVGGEPPRVASKVTPVIEQGRIINVVCGPGGPIVEVTTTAKGVLRLVIDDQFGIRVTGKPSPRTDLTCGAQNAAIRVGYEPAPDRTRNTAGKLRLLDYAVK